MKNVGGNTNEKEAMALVDRIEESDLYVKVFVHGVCCIEYDKYVVDVHDCRTDRNEVLQSVEDWEKLAGKEVT